MTLAPRTDRTWELFPHGLLVFERADPGTHRMLISRVESCTTPGCSCREVGLRAVALDIGGDFDPAVFASEALRSRLASAEAMNAQLEIDLGTVMPDDREGRVPLSDDWAAYLRSQVDGELLDRLHAHWLRSKGMAPATRTDWEPRPPGDLVGWYEAHPGDRADLFVDGDDVFIAEDLYCVNPTCTCAEAMVAFSRATSQGAPDVGAIRVRTPALDVVERDVTPDNTALFDRLWTAFLARHRRLAERLIDRKKHMLDLASQQRKPARRTVQAGRNEPCPCGSGKKYKRCCA